MDYLGWTYYLLMSVVLLIGFALNVLGLPGLWVMVLGTVAFSWVTGWGKYAGWPTFWAMIALATAAEIVEFAAGAAGSKSAGGTKRGMIGATIGGLIGGLALSVLIPIPVLGTIVGACAGAAAGAAMVERLIVADSVRALKVGYGAAKGRLYGIIVKALFGCVMAIVALITCLPYGVTGTPQPGAILTPPTPPATAPARP